MAGKEQHDADPREMALQYHERTKHGLGRFARSLGYLDWENQPNPFRIYRGAPTIPLEEIPPSETPSLDDVIEGRAKRTPATKNTISQLFYDSLALSAWKSFGGQRWSLRCNPSSGNLHPTEAYVLAGPDIGLEAEAGLYHYSPLLHALERRSEIVAELWDAFTEKLPPGSFLVGLTSIHWRESWKYGERAYRYCQLDVGHAAAALGYAAAALGWRTIMLEGWGDDELATMLGVADQTGPEREHPDCLILIATEDVSHEEMGSLPWWRPSHEQLESLKKIALMGEPNRLSSEHHKWEIIDSVAEACRKRTGDGANLPSTACGDASVPPLVTPRAMGARGLFRQRRSAVDMDGETWLDAESFYRLLAALHPARPPFNVLAWEPSVQLVIYVHRLRGLEPGLYVLVRESHERQEELRGIMSRDFIWRKPPDSPDELSLFLLERGDFRKTSQLLCCNQEIASHGAFAVGMLANFTGPIASRPWFYRRLFWEAGAIGQALYIEAEAARLRATGIGCFFDDEAHQIVGIEGSTPYQYLYHLTVGGAVEDERIDDLPPYLHRRAEKGG